MNGLKDINRRTNQFIDKASEETTFPKWWLYVDCIFNCMFRKKSIRDYFIYKFYYLNRFGKHEYLGGLEQNAWQDAHNDKVMEDILVNKEKCLKHFSGIITRDWCGVTENYTEELYKQFEEKHTSAIFKPLTSCGGKGVKIFKLSDVPGGGHISFVTKTSA